MKGSQLFERERSLKPPPLPSNVILNLPTKKVPLGTRNNDSNYCTDEKHETNKVTPKEGKDLTPSNDVKGYDKENSLNPTPTSIENATGTKEVLKDNGSSTIYDVRRNLDSAAPNTSIVESNATCGKVQISVDSEKKESKSKEEQSKEVNDASTTVPTSSSPSSSSLSTTDGQVTNNTDFRKLDFFDSTVGHLPLILSDNNQPNHKFDINETMKILIVGCL